VPTRNDLRKRLDALARDVGSGGIRLDNPWIDCSWLYAGGEADFPLDWLRDPMWREVARDESIAVYRHRKTKALRAVFLPISDAEYLRRGGDLAFL
jgi:hypothetical protein